MPRSAAELSFILAPDSDKTAFVGVHRHREDYRTAAHLTVLDVLLAFDGGFDQNGNRFTAVGAIYDVFRQRLHGLVSSQISGAAAVEFEPGARWVS